MSVYISIYDLVSISELKSSLQQPREVRMQNMRNKLISLGQLYSNNERYFPTSKNCLC